MRVDENMPEPGPANKLQWKHSVTAPTPHVVARACVNEGSSLSGDEARTLTSQNNRSLTEWRRGERKERKRVGRAMPRRHEKECPRQQHTRTSGRITVLECRKTNGGYQATAYRRPEEVLGVRDGSALGPVTEQVLTDAVPASMETSTFRDGASARKHHARVHAIAAHTERRSARESKSSALSLPSPAKNEPSLDAADAQEPETNFM